MERRRGTRAPGGRRGVAGYREAVLGVQGLLGLVGRGRRWERVGSTPGRGVVDVMLRIRNMASHKGEVTRAG